MAKPGHDRMPVSPGRPRVQLDEGLLLELADLGLGYKRIAREYSRRTGEYVSHTTVRDRLGKDAKDKGNVIFSAQMLRDSGASGRWPGLRMLRRVSCTPRRSSRLTVGGCRILKKSCKR